MSPDMMPEQPTGPAQQSATVPLSGPEQPSAVFVRFLLDADPSPGLLSRLLQPYAKRDLVPDRMWSHRAGDTMHVEIAMEAMPAEMVHLVEGNLRQVVGVRGVSRVTRSCLREVA
jgi:hypothetical protein